VWSCTIWSSSMNVMKSSMIKDDSFQGELVEPQPWPLSWDEFLAVHHEIHDFHTHITNFRQIWLSITRHWQESSTHLISFYMFTNYELCCLFIYWTTSILNMDVSFIVKYIWWNKEKKKKKNGMCGPNASSR
jgi:hypothetical protein